MDTQDPATRELVLAAGRGDADAARRLAPLVYEELRRIAHHYMRPSPENTLQPTALVHEAWLKFADSDSANARSHTHFRAIASRAMRQVLVDHARERAMEKHGGAHGRVSFVTGIGAREEETLDVDAIDAALLKLAAVDARAARIVEMRFFGGMTEEAIAEVLGITDRTVRNDWRMARAWLRVELSPDV